MKLPVLLFFFCQNAFIYTFPCNVIQIQNNNKYGVSEPTQNLNEMRINIDQGNDLNDDGTPPTTVSVTVASKILRVTKTHPKNVTVASVDSVVHKNVYDANYEKGLYDYIDDKFM